MTVVSGLIVDSSEHAAIRATVAEIADSFGAEYFSTRSRDHLGIEELWTQLGEAGLLGVHLPEVYGGGGAGLSELVVVIEELAAHGMPILNIVVSPAICGSIIAAHGSEAMKQEWVPALASGAKKMAFCLTEPDAGSNTHKITTTLTRSGSGWALSGSKYYISGADDADALLVVARDGESPVDASGRGKLSLVIVELPSPGIMMHPLETAVIAPEKQFTVFFDDVSVSDEAVIGEPGRGLRLVFAGLNPERIVASAISNGIGRFAIDRAVAYAKTRTVWDAPIGSHQGISHPLAHAHIQVELARLATANAAAISDAGLDASSAANMAKLAAADASIAALDQAIQVHGGNGLSREYGLTDLWFAARFLRTAPVTREMILNFVAQTTLGLPPSY